MHKPKTSTNLDRLYLDPSDTDKVLNNPEIKRQRLTADGYRHAATVTARVDLKDPRPGMESVIRTLCDRTNEDTLHQPDKVRADVQLVLIPDPPDSHDAIREIWIRD